MDLSSESNHLFITHVRVFNSIHMRIRYRRAWHRLFFILGCILPRKGRDVNRRGRWLLWWWRWTTVGLKDLHSITSKLQTRRITGYLSKKYETWKKTKESLIKWVTQPIDWQIHKRNHMITTCSETYELSLLFTCLWSLSTAWVKAPSAALFTRAATSNSASLFSCVDEAQLLWIDLSLTSDDSQYCQPYNSHKRERKNDGDNSEERLRD